MLCGMNAKQVPMTSLEMRSLFMAAALAESDIDKAGFNGHEKAAYRRAMRKLGNAYEIPIRRHRRGR